jgi:hypothetical protein
MDLSLNGDEIVFRTPYSDAFDLIQVMRGVDEGAPDANHPVDFRLAGLQRRGMPISGTRTGCWPFPRMNARPWSSTARISAATTVTLAACGYAPRTTAKRAATQVPCGGTRRAAGGRGCAWIRPPG